MDSIDSVVKNMYKEIRQDFVSFIEELFENSVFIKYVEKKDYFSLNIKINKNFSYNVKQSDLDAVLRSILTFSFKEPPKTTFLTFAKNVLKKAVETMNFDNDLRFGQSVFISCVSLLKDVKLNEIVNDCFYKDKNVGEFLIEVFKKERKNVYI